ncbi:universal stress protein [Crenobacter sp. SG2303]|uniref:Universal stress protein n=1 Tax=Crenobacter oryzisoli TaxID=3056844 RepID=A0ABT7XSF7_9NEIS|nr:universal stress protein [Crenobacter sp. SG2303]MDN0076717.1 universal stress protein [Crenobacter sp. SG2303]
MGYKSIIVHVDSTPGCRNRVEIAALLAQRFNAHLTGLFTNWLPSLESNIAELPVHAFTSASYEYAEKCANQAQETFDSVVRAVGLDKIEWRKRIGRPIETLCLNARYHDLVVLGQSNPEQSVDNRQNDLVQQTVLGAGRPVLVMPYAGSFSDVGQQALVGWDARREATRALTDALPLLKLAKKTTVQTFNSHSMLSPQGELPGADISLYLARHGVPIELMADIDGVMDTGSQLLMTAANVGADLLVMGAYGHSRLLEIVLGGATKTVLESMTIPVLMSH